MKMQLDIRTWRRNPRHRQRGVAMPLVAVGLVAMLAIAGLALDASHGFSNKSHLQNFVDAAALAAAKAFDDSLDVTAGEAAAYSILGLNADGAGNQEMKSAYDSGRISVVIQWSENLDPFVSAGVGPYVRVVATGFDAPATLSSVLGIDEIEVAASAVAGPSPSINNACNIAPMVVCAMDPDDEDLFGFEPNQLEVLKSAAGDGSDVGPGNFQLVRLDCPGGACVRENLAGDYNGCVAQDEEIETEPGNTVGPTVQGLNTRFGSYSGPISDAESYPPDVVVTQPEPALTYDDSTDSVHQGGAVVDETTLDYGFADYQSDVAANAWDYAPPTGVFERRVLALPVARCDGSSSGQSTLEVVGFGCYFLLQEVKQQGSEAQIFGQFVEGCDAGGSPGPAPDAGPAPYIIQLYRDMASQDS